MSERGTKWPRLFRITTSTRRRARGVSTITVSELEWR